MFGGSSSGGGSGGGGNMKRGKGGGGSSRNNHQNPQEVIHTTVPVPVMAPGQAMTHIQPLFQTFHQPAGMHTMIPIQFTYLQPHPGFPSAVPQAQYMFPRAYNPSSVPVNLQAFNSIPQSLNQNHSSPNPLTTMRSSHGPLVVGTAGTSNALHAASSTTSTSNTHQKKRTHALPIIDPETRKPIKTFTSNEDEDKKEVVKEKKKADPPTSDDSANKVDCQMQTDVPVQVIKPKVEEKKEQPDNGKYILLHI